ncbi:MAG: 1-pyrroline-5-carboxylate dehydrogenase [Gammaproteobacteria bacterium]|nr:MAG: 1-pyrroline-5-carboxylate dehydrogenase [Gammaproteobacteria bacterium]
MPLEQRIGELCSELITSTETLSNEQRGGEWNGQHWLDALVARAISDPQFRIQTLRFIDVLPSLNDDLALTRHLQEYFGDNDSPLPELARWGLKQSDKPWLAHVAAPLVRYTVRGLARRFMGGNNIRRASATLERLKRGGMNSSLDILGEASVSEDEADVYQRSYLEMIPAMSAYLQTWEDSNVMDQLHGRLAPRLNVSVKLSSLYSQIDVVDSQGCVAAIKKRLIPILECAREHQAFVMIDMEQYDFKDIILSCFLEILQDHRFQHWPDIGIAIQAYLKDSFADLIRIVEVVKQRETPATVRLVRGAYWDYETIVAAQNHWSSPVWLYKQDTDANFERCLAYLFAAHPLIETAVATHNIRSLAVAMALAEKHKLSKRDYEFQMLYGMADTLKKTLVQRQQQLRVYVPYGETLPGMAYLVRRLLENSSGQTVLDMGLTSQQQVKLDKPVFSSKPNSAGDAHVLSSVDSVDVQFENQPLFRFTDTTEHEAFAQGLSQCRQQFAQNYPLIIDGKSCFTKQTIVSSNPARPEETIGYVATADRQLADAAIIAAKKAHEYWRRVSVTERADHLRSIARLLQERRIEFASWQVFEAGKNWREADADVCEAIDFLNYYAEQAEQLELTALGSTVLVQATGEKNTIRYHGRGVGLVIPPWNFPLAILTGMLSATIVCGNTAILKPSSQTPVIAARFVELMQQAGLPDGVVNLLSGRGADIGDYLAKHDDIQMIAFTGSLAVGSRLINHAAQLQPGQKQFKRIIAEMGGKNAIIVDEDADLDVAVSGTVSSAFGFQGQKCSAASRVIVLDHVYDQFLERLIAAARSLQIGLPEEPGNAMGPVISKQARNNILSAIEKAKREARIVSNDCAGYSATVDLTTGYFIPPVIFADVAADSRLAQQEIFGPVLSVFRAGDFDQALQLANHSQYALTGGVFSRDPNHLQRAKNEINVGNLYLNRKITGARVSRQPFGGYKLSGIGYKAGGSDYLLQFMDSTTITENTMRRGFAPTEDDK